MRNPRNPSDCEHFPLCEHLKPLTGRLTNGRLDTRSRALPREAESICNACDSYLGRQGPTAVEQITSTVETGKGNFRVELRFGNITIREYRLQDGNIHFIGRAPENHIVIDDSRVSRDHACIKQLGDQLFIWDRGSKHGTFVEDVEVICANLKHGDVVSIGINHTLKASITTQNKEGTISASFDCGRKPISTS